MTYEENNGNALHESASDLQNGVGTCEASDTALTQPRSLPVLINALARARRGHKAPHLVSTLIEQCKNFDRNPDAMRPKILRTIEAIEKAA